MNTATKLLLITTVSIPAITLAAPTGYAPLVEWAGNPAASDFNSYINTLYAVSISIAALLAVIKIIIAGVKWMVTDVVPSKGEAKKDIQNALFGLLIVLTAVLILTVINPNLTKVNIDINKVTNPAYTGTSVPITLDKTKEVTQSILGSSATVSYMQAGSGAEQDIAFMGECGDTTTQTESLISTPEGALCFTHSPQEKVQDLLICNPPDCRSADFTTAVINRCEFDSDGTYVADPRIPTRGYCIVDRY